jgi:hypothetical protein
MLAVGVGHKEHASSHMWRTHSARGYARPFRVIPDSGQVPKNPSQSSRKEPCYVLHDHVARSKLANQSPHFSPESASDAVEPSATTGIANVLAGESADKHIDGWEAIGARPCVKSSIGMDSPDVLIAPHLRPVPLKHGATERIDLDLPTDVEARPRESQIEPTDPSEQRPDW